MEPQPYPTRSPLSQVTRRIAQLPGTVAGMYQASPMATPTSTHTLTPTPTSLPYRGPTPVGYAQAVLDRVEAEHTEDPPTIHRLSCLSTSLASPASRHPWPLLPLTTAASHHPWPPLPSLLLLHTLLSPLTDPEYLPLIELEP